jgi:ATP-dependent RNA helicase DDX46/PRP5
LQDEGSGGEEVEEDDATWAKNVTAGKLSKGDKLMAADHSTIEYPHFRRNFYIEVGVLPCWVDNRSKRRCA